MFICFLVVVTGAIDCYDSLQNTYQWRWLIGTINVDHFLYYQLEIKDIETFTIFLSIILNVKLAVKPIVNLMELSFSIEFWVIQLH